MSTTPTTTATVVDAFLAAVTSGEGVPESVYAPEATLDATVPNWRLTCRGPAAIADEYGRWFAHPGQLRRARPPPHRRR